MKLRYILAPAEICKMDPFRRLDIKIVQTSKVSNINLAALPQKAFSPTQNHHCKLWLSTRGGSAINYVYIRMSRFIHGGFLKYGRNIYGGTVDKTTLSRLFIAVPTSCCGVTTTHVCNFSFSTNRTHITIKSSFYMCKASNANTKRTAASIYTKYKCSLASLLQSLGGSTAYQKNQNRE